MYLSKVNGLIIINDAFTSVKAEQTLCFIYFYYCSSAYNDVIYFIADDIFFM